MSKVKVKPSLLAGDTTPLERAGDAQDRFVETLGDRVMRQLAGILESKNAETMARVSAVKAILEWIRPKAGMKISINSPTHLVSHLHLPPPIGDEPQVSDAVDVEVIEDSVPQIGPEPASPVQAARLRAFEEVSIAPAPEPPQLPERSPTPREPDMPEKASSIRQFS